MTKTPIYSEEEHEFLGNLVKDSTSWLAQTIFGYTMARTDTKEEALEIIRTKGLSYLMGTWQYYDKDDHDWFPCVIQEAGEHKVTVIRTNILGYQDPDDYKRVILKDPDENLLIKNS